MLRRVSRRLCTVASADPLPLVAIVGAPNAGKSTFYNRLVRQQISRVAFRPKVRVTCIYADAASRPRRSAHGVEREDK